MRMRKFNNYESLIIYFGAQARQHRKKCISNLLKLLVTIPKEIGASLEILLTVLVTACRSFKYF